MDITESQLVRSIDQTNLSPSATQAEIVAFVTSARAFGFCSVAVMPVWVPLSTQLLQGSRTTVVAAVAFPLGTCTTYSKVAETEWAVEHGPGNVEIDMVMNVSLMKSHRHEELEKEIRAVVEAARGRLVKVIIEVPLLTREEVVTASLIAGKAGADFIKTSTGFKALERWRPSTPDDVRLIRSAVGSTMRVKVAGGISTLSQALAVLEAGANRIGTSAGGGIVETFREETANDRQGRFDFPNRLGS